jgi:GAF domain-containing protein
VVDLARELTGARYAALAVTDRHDRTQGFFVAGLDPGVLKALKGPPQGHGPLGSLREDGRPVRYENVEQARKSFGFPPRHPHMKKLMGIALWVGTNVRGSIYITDREDGAQFDDDDERVLLTLGRHASVVIEQRWF